MTAAPLPSVDTLDVGPVNVTGRVRARRSRVLWADGTLYVMQAENNVRSFPVPDEPVLDDQGVWTAVVAGDGVDAGKHIHFTRKGCPTCGYRLARFPQTKVLAVAENRIKRATDPL